MGATSDMNSSSFNNKCYIESGYLYSLDNGRDYTRRVIRKGLKLILECPEGKRYSILGKVKLSCSIEIETSIAMMIRIIGTTNWTLSLWTSYRARFMLLCGVVFLRLMRMFIMT